MNILEFETWFADRKAEIERVFGEPVRMAAFGGTVFSEFLVCSAAEQASIHVLIYGRAGNVDRREETAANIGSLLLIQKGIAASR